MLVAIIVGGGLFGIVGMVVGVPVMAVLAALLKQAVGAGLTARGLDPATGGESPLPPRTQTRRKTRRLALCTLEPLQEGAPYAPETLAGQKTADHQRLAGLAFLCLAFFTLAGQAGRLLPLWARWRG